MRYQCTSLLPCVILAVAAGAYAQEPIAVEDALGKAKTYAFGDSRAALNDLEQAVHQRQAHPAKYPQLPQQLASLLGSDTTYECKLFACRQLARIGTEAEVAALAPLLRDPRTADMARYALEQMPCEAAERALIDALPDLTGRGRVGVVNSLANRRSAGAVNALAGLLPSTDEEAASAAAGALGMIGSPEAAQAFEPYLDASEGAFADAVAEALLMCADAAVRTDRKTDAAAMYERVYQAHVSGPQRAAALKGLGAAGGGDDLVKIAVAALSDASPAVRKMAARLVQQVPGEDATAVFVKTLRKLDVEGQVMLLSALAARGDTRALPQIERQSRSKNEAVRVAALRAVGTLGDASEVGFLAERAAKEAGDLEHETARKALTALQGVDIEAHMAGLIAQSAPAIRVELVQALYARFAREQLPAILAATSDESEEVRAAAYHGLRRLAVPADLAKVVDVLLEVPESDRPEALKTVAAVAGKGEGPERAAPLLAALDKAQDPDTRGALLEILGRVGGADALAALRAALGDADSAVRTAAVRGLVSWPDAAPIEDLRNLASTSDDPKCKVLALRGYIDHIGRADALSPEDKLARYKEALALAQQTAERQQAIAAIGGLPTMTALDTAVSYLDDAEVRQEAALAAGQIAERVCTWDTEKVGKMMGQLIDGDFVDAAKDQARRVLEVIEEHHGFVGAWMVAGPYMQEGANEFDLFDIVFPPEKPGAEEVEWRPVPPEMGAPWNPNLAAFIGSDFRVAYLRSYVWSEKARACRLETGSDDGIKVWLNGAVVHGENVNRGCEAGQDKVDARLEQGWNTLLMKITQGQGGWNACARFVAPDGAKIDGFKVRAQIDTNPVGRNRP